MTFQQLREFCIVSKYENVTKAAEILFITQPALSMTLKKIEAEVGMPLFDRRGRYIYLNENGKMFYRFASKTLKEWEALMEKFHEPETDDKLLRFCFSARYIPDYVLPMFSANNPNIPISIKEVDEKLIMPFLQNEVCDIAVSGVCPEEHDAEGIVSTFFFKNQLLVSVPANNPLSSRRSIQFEDLHSEKFIRLSKQGEFTAEVNAQAKEHGIMLTTLQLVNYEVIKILQNNFDFLYFITSLQAEFDHIPLKRRLIPVEGDGFVKDMYISYLEKNREKVQPFVQWANTRLGLSAQKEMVCDQ